MKTMTLILLGTSTVFAATSLFLTHRVREDRAEVLEVQVERNALAERVKQLEEQRSSLANEVELLRATTESAAMPPVPRPVLAGADPTPKNAIANERHSAVFTGFRAPPPASPLMQKMMRGRLRQSLARTYDGLGEAVGLTPEQSRKLLDLLADQSAPWSFDPAKMQERAQQHQADLEALLGPEKMARLQEYQKSLPARHELLNLQEQFAAAEVPLGEEQRSQLLDNLIEDGKRNNRPAFFPSTEPEQARAAVIAWEQERDERMLESVQDVLTAEQMAVFREQQEYQREMRKHMEMALPLSIAGEAVAGSMSAVTIVQPPPQ